MMFLYVLLIVLSAKVNGLKFYLEPRQELCLRYIDVPVTIYAHFSVFLSNEVVKGDTLKGYYESDQMLRGLLNQCCIHYMMCCVFSFFIKPQWYYTISKSKWYIRP